MDSVKPVKLQNATHSALKPKGTNKKKEGEEKKTRRKKIRSSEREATTIPGDTTDSPVHVSPLLVKFLLVFNELQRYTISEQLESLSNQSETYTVALESVLSELEQNKNDKTISYEEKEGRETVLSH
ncbi:hypothetical protein [Candidatus Coxiella mudrowiae]|uniref:Cytosolic protein n=1 Tax=Candidatus Coxiella mudrowiae TaxID=2054173 RepID=A0ABN4HSP5_9COXI|nr:hypothetical protein [Candidatus Coxiella mudrowiae]AKQ33939.1 hypothetical protein CleRT_13900 [Candidatus Coxiella mudrowiae]